MNINISVCLTQNTYLLLMLNLNISCSHGDVKKAFWIERWSAGFIAY